MARPLPNITEAELAVLQLLWERGPATVRQLTEVLYPKGGPSEYATVHKLLERLAAKEFVGRDRSGGPYVFRAAVARDDIIGRQLEAFIDKMCGGSLGPLLSNLVRVKRLSPDELRELRELVDNLDPKPRREKDRN
jgi:predicted transcriptional regulator